MMFRRLYWVTEDLHADGSSTVKGVYTSIPDLVNSGLQNLNGRTGLRLHLVKLDSANGPLGTWISPKFDGLEERLQEFVQTDEFTSEHCKLLSNELKRLAPPTAKAS